MDIKITEISPLDPRVHPLFEQLDKHNLSHCPPEVCHLTQPEELEQTPSILLAIIHQDVLIGMGGLKLYNEYAEVTRMFVKAEYRGKGLSRQLLQRLEHHAKHAGHTLLKLETSTLFEAAYQLYQNYGFVDCAPFGEYINKALNTYMEKRIE